MKNKIKLTVITALFAVIGFVMTACDDNIDSEQERQIQSQEVMFVWKGELPAAPANPQINWIYYNTNDKAAYIYDGSSWKVLVKDGVDGSAADISAEITARATATSSVRSGLFNLIFVRSSPHTLTKHTSLHSTRRGCFSLKKESAYPSIYDRALDLV